MTLFFDRALTMRLADFLYGAGDGIRTRDINLGKVALYQLSYSRVRASHSTFSR